MSLETCELCEQPLAGRRFTRRGCMASTFCSRTCVEAFETRTGLPAGRVYESRPGWSPFPVVQAPPQHLVC